ncbi:hypothetical protein GCM10023169_13720 [Georgenia halophila]|uniref:SprT-like family protein n=2 Tax=Georgenia halophila TaxID=620889 RepID=A0ABP8L2R0_9MICO
MVPNDHEAPRAPEFLDAADHLTRLADGLMHYVVTADPIAAPGSVAELEASDSSFDDPRWGRPTFELLYDPNGRLHLAADHVRALSVVSAADRVVLATATLARAALESLSATFWLYEPGVGVRERVCRRMNLRLLSLVEQWNMAVGFEDPTARDKPASESNNRCSRHDGPLVDMRDAASWQPAVQHELEHLLLRPEDRKRGHHLDPTHTRNRLSRRRRTHPGAWPSLDGPCGEVSAQVRASAAVSPAGGRPGAVVIHLMQYAD